MRFMLPTFTPSYDGSFSDSVPSFGRPRPSISTKPIPTGGNWKDLRNIGLKPDSGRTPTWQEQWSTRLEQAFSFGAKGYGDLPTGVRPPVIP